MKNQLGYALLILLFLTSSAAAAGRMQYELAPGVVVSFIMPGDRWQASADAPEALIRETAAHVRYHFLEDGREVPTDLETRVRQRLKQNELFIYNPSTTAHLDMDISPVTPEEGVPSADTVKASAGYAAKELQQEQDLSQVQSSYAPSPLGGALSSYRIDASYLKDGSPRTFIGYVGAIPSGWFFLYYTDKQKNTRDLNEIEVLLDSFRFETSAH